MQTRIISGDIGYAAGILLAGGVVSVPTETVYGLAANGLDAAAVSEIYRVKGRPENKPISLLVSGMEMAVRFTRDVPESAFLLAEAFWPGPLTMVLRKGAAVPPVVSAGGDTVGVRCPDHPLTLEILRAASIPLAAPSANPSGEPAPTDAAQVLAYFDGRIPCIVDGGACSVGVASTVLDLSGETPRILRKGVISAGEISRVLKGSEVICG